MKLNLVLAAVSLIFSSITFAQNVQPLIFQPKPDNVLITPAAARCDVTRCQSDCYVAKSQCGRNDDSGCSAKVQACLQACTSSCR